MRAIGFGAVALAAGALTIAVWAGVWGHSRSATDGLALATVRRETLEVVVVVPGEVGGAERTVIACEIEDLRLDGTRSFGPTLTEVVADGATVRKGDVLCRFDDSNFTELARRQKIEVEYARAQLRQAELDLESARVALRAYRDGEAVQKAQQLAGSSALLRADLARARERLEWARRMRDLGYISADELAEARIARQRLELNLRAADLAERNHARFLVPKGVRELEVKVEQAQEAQEFATAQLNLTRDRLAHLEEQIDKCILRAPHDGLVVHAATMFDWEEIRLRVGAPVFQGQPLLYIPDLTRPVVEVSLHETVAGRVRVGMLATIRIEAYPDRTFSGQVVEIDQIPSINWQAGMDVHHFRARVRLDDPPTGDLLPGLSAQVRIVTGTWPDALIVPASALSVEAGRSYCYVADTAGHFQRRPVTLTHADTDRLRVVAGLSEGERVVLDPPPGLPARSSGPRSTTAGTSPSITHACASGPDGV